MSPDDPDVKLARWLYERYGRVAQTPQWSWAAIGRLGQDRWIGEARLVKAAVERYRQA